jgi:hypothetical protein
MISQNYPDSDDHTILGCVNCINIVFTMYNPINLVISTSTACLSSTVCGAIEAQNLKFS